MFLYRQNLMPNVDKALSVENLISYYMRQANGKMWTIFNPWGCGGCLEWSQQKEDFIKHQQIYWIAHTQIPSTHSCNFVTTTAPYDLGSPSQLVYKQADDELGWNQAPRGVDLWQMRSKHWKFYLRYSHTSKTFKWVSTVQGHLWLKEERIGIICEHNERWILHARWLCRSDTRATFIIQQLHRGLSLLGVHHIVPWCMR